MLGGLARPRQSKAFYDSQRDVKMEKTFMSFVARRKHNFQHLENALGTPLPAVIKGYATLRDAKLAESSCMLDTLNRSKNAMRKIWLVTLIVVVVKSTMLNHFNKLGSSEQVTLHETTALDEIQKAISHVTANANASMISRIGQLRRHAETDFDHKQLSWLTEVNTVAEQQTMDIRRLT